MSRVAVVGPTHPYTGGIVHHTTELAHRLAAGGGTVELVSWSSQFPLRLYPGDPLVPWDEPELVPHPRTRYGLHWARPGSWHREGRRLGAGDTVVLVVANPLQAVPYRALLRAAGPGVRHVAVVHNVVPHEPRPHHAPLMRWLLGAVDRVVVHSDDQARLARLAGARPGAVRVAPLAPHFPGPPSDRPSRPGRRVGPVRLVFFGTVRPYKGLDLLLAALARAPDATLVVAGEFWQPIDEVRRLADRVGVADRVELRPGYVRGADVPDLLRSADVVVLPYRSGTASQNVALAAAHGVPVVVTDVGTLGTEVRDGHDGLVVPAGDVPALAAALRRLAGPGVLEALRAHVSRRDADALWRDYVGAVLDDDRGSSAAEGGLPQHEARVDHGRAAAGLA